MKLIAWIRDDEGLTATFIRGICFIVAAPFVIGAIVCVLFGCILFPMLAAESGVTHWIGVVGSVAWGIGFILLAGREFRG